MGASLASRAIDEHLNLYAHTIDSDYACTIDQRDEKRTETSSILAVPTSNRAAAGQVYGSW